MTKIELTRRATLATVGGALISRSSTPVGGTSPVSPMSATVSVMDHIPVELHASIKNGRCALDLAPFFQAAAVAANSGVARGAGPGGVVFVPAGTYPVSIVGIRETIILGEHRESTRIVAAPSARVERFLLDAMLDRDGVTQNTNGGGFASNLSIDAANSGASGLRTYGGGCTAHDLTITGARIGLAIGLPIWSTFQNIHVVGCGTGIFTFALNEGDSGTSTTFTNCWAVESKQYGFHITQLMYSSLINCVSQDCDGINFYVEGDRNGSPAAYSLQIFGCGTEGRGKPFHLKKCRDFTLIGARIVGPTRSVDHITLEDSAGSIRDFSTPGPPVSPAVSVRLVNHGAPPGGVLIDDSIVVIDPKFQAYFTVVGGSLNGGAGIQATALTLSTPIGGASTQPELLGRAPAITWRSDHTRIAAFGLHGGTILSAVPNPDLVQAIEPGDVAISLTADGSSLRLSFKDAVGRTRAVELPGRLTR